MGPQREKEWNEVQTSVHFPGCIYSINNKVARNVASTEGGGVCIYLYFYNSCQIIERKFPLKGVVNVP